MLKELIIDNLVLIDHATLTFCQGFTVLSGETGSGKSAVLSALSLVCGSRADGAVVRHGESKGSAQAIFHTTPKARHFLEEAGIDLMDSEECILKREVHANGKSRAFINQQPVQIAFLKTFTEMLVECVGQYASQKLLAPSFHRNCVDEFSGLQDLLCNFTSAYDEERHKREELNRLQEQLESRLSRIDFLQRQIAELEEAALQEGEEELLFAEYTRLINGEEIAQKTAGLQETLQEGALVSLLQSLRLIQDLIRIDPAFSEAKELLEQATLHLRELEAFNAKMLTRIDQSPERAQVVNQRLTVLNKIQKKFASTIPRLLVLLASNKEELASLQCADEKIEELENELAALKSCTDSLGKKLSAAREKGAFALSDALGNLLGELNMSSATVRCFLKPAARSRFGDETIEIHLAANLGEKMLPLKECASGGELSRVFLALQTLLADNESTQTLVFDEIDANIGGKTAAVIGRLMQKIGRRHQVIAVTHFPQAAKFADQHLQLVKVEEEGRTITRVFSLGGQSRQKELDRMAGKEV